ncbi:MAG TPA: hypothetical protein VK689_15550 [Armatimonadota bacterium]|nr:hypothetical protein [Armatimonadota bacterium]
MITPDPSWTYSPERPVPVWEADVHLFPETVVGVLNGRQWVCLERGTGRLLWEQRRLGRPNRICSLAGDVLIATEHRRNDGPWAANFGIYGVSLAEGRLVWTSHAPGRWGRFLRLLDFIPDFTNELRDDPLWFEGPEIVTSGGRRLEAATGTDIGCREVSDDSRRASETFSSRLLAWKEIPVGELGTLVLGRPGKPETPGHVGTDPLRFYLRSPEGDVCWQFQADREERIRGPHYWGLSFDYFYPFVYFAAADRLHASRPGGSLFRLLALDLRTGQFSQDLPVSPNELDWCEIESCDSSSLLVGTKEVTGKYQLSHFARGDTAST